MIRALLRRLRCGLRPRRGYAAGGYVGPGSKYQPAGYLHRGDYVYRASDGTFWHVQQDPDGDTRTQLDPEGEA